METKKTKTVNKPKKLSKLGQYWQSELYKEMSKTVKIDMEAVMK